MCGIIAVLSRPETRVVPIAADLLARLDSVLEAWAAADGDLPGDDSLRQMAAATSVVDAALRGDAGMWLMAGNREFIAGLN
ncbi:MAG: hypothetical protein RLZZ518_1496, partial [Actinomycetota bacterium]